MGNLYVSLAEQLQLLICEPDRVDRQKVFVQHAEPLQMLHGALAPAGVGIFFFLLGLGNVHVNADAVFIGQLLRADAKLVRVVENRAQTEPDLYAAIRRVVVFFKVQHLLLQLLLHGALPDRRQTLAAVHHGFGQLAAQTGLRGRARHAGHELSAGLCKGCHAGADQLQTGHQRGDIGVFFGHIALKGPHPIVQPANKIYIIAHAARNLLGGMDVRIDKAGEYILPLQVDHLGIRLNQLRIYLANRQNAVVFHQDAAAVKNGIGLVHGNDIAVLQICLHAHPPFCTCICTRKMIYSQYNL